MYAVKKAQGEDIWTVGIHHYSGGSTIWYSLRDCSSDEEAFAFINYLNGGKGNPFPGSD
jgi:hypothetical protein